MKCIRLTASVLMIAAMGTFGCSKPNSATPAASNASKPASDSSVKEHAHGSGPNGGVVMDLGSHHAEFTVNHGKQEVTVLVLGDDEKTPLPVAATEFVLNIKATKTAD